MGIDGRKRPSPIYPCLSHAGCFLWSPWNVFHFSDSVRENIRLGRAEASNAEVEEAAARARIHDFIARLPQGYNTLVGERGVRLSGGGRQKIAIARALLKKAPILILDEATSGLDADAILVMRDWRLVEQGRHRELLALRGEYARLVAAQRNGLEERVAR